MKKKKERAITTVEEEPQWTEESNHSRMSEYKDDNLFSKTATQNNNSFKQASGEDYTLMETPYQQ